MGGRDRNGAAIAATGAIAVFVLAAPASAALHVYEGFNYTDGSTLIAASGGSGFSDNWTDTGASTETATAPGLTYGDLATVGNKASLQGAGGATSGNSSFIVRNTTNAFGTDGTSVWISFIGDRTGAKSGTTPTYERVFGMSIFSSAGTERAAFGEVSNDANDQWGLVAGTINTAGTSRSTVAIDQESLILVRIDFGAANNDSAFMWVNPSLAAGEAGLGAAHASRVGVGDLSFSRLRLTAGGSQGTGGVVLAASGVLDEIRIGDTFLDVTPIPEPAAAGLLALSAGAMLTRRRHRQG